MGISISVRISFGFSVVAEGVETETQQAVLLQMQCDHYQGFLCAPGLPAQEFRAMLARPLPLNARGRRSSVQN